MRIDGSDHLAHLSTRRSVRAFREGEIASDVVERLMRAATSAPSNTNRQPWKFAIVRGAKTRAAIVQAIRERAKEMQAIIARGHHANDYGKYGDFFFEPLASAAAIVVPQYREYPDLIAQFIESGGGNPAMYDTAAKMQAELCSTSAACMCLLLQAHAEGLGACWMAGPTIARREISELIGIRAPWTMLGAIALGHPETTSVMEPPRKALESIVTLIDD